MRRQDVVAVQNFTKGTGSIGQNTYSTPAGLPVNVPCNVYPLTAELIETYGLQELDSRLVVCDTWPGDPHSRITFEGAEWDPASPVKKYNKTPSARSLQIVIKKRG